MSNDVSKQEYLKRYLGKDKKQKRRKKTEANIAKVSRLKIVDQNIDLKSINFGDKVDVDDDDEAPVVAEVIDDRPLEEKIKELYDSSRWKKLNSNDNSQLDASRNLGDISNDSNISSVRKSQNSSKRVRHDSDGDISPLRKSSEKKRHDSGSDLSPPRKRNDNLQNKRHDSDSDMSPPRKRSEKKSQNYDSDMSPPRKNEDNSQKKRLNSGSDISPPRKSSYEKRSDFNSDISPPRNKNSKNQRNQHDSNDNISLSRRNRTKSEKKINNSDSDISLPSIHNKQKADHKHYSNKYNSGDDKNSRNMSGSKNHERGVNNSDSDLSPPHRKSMKSKSKKLQKTLSGLKAGLQDAETLRKETEQLRKREKIQMNMLDDDLSGRNAETVIRDRKTGLRRDLDKEQQVKDEENKKVEEHQKKYTEWGKGIEQTQNKMDKFADDVYEMSKPLARYRDDEDLDERLKAVIRDDDPMSEYIKKKRQKNMPVVPAYSGPPAPPNRFGIQPGYRWDGVDRSNGFEKKYFEKINSTKAIQEESYLWSVQDM